MATRKKLRRSMPPIEGSVTDRDSDIVTVTWDGPNDAEDPYNWPFRKKCCATGLGLFASFVCSMNGTILTVAHEAINEEFHISDTGFPNSYWPVASWGVGAALIPMFLFPVMEDVGIRPIVLGTYLAFICFLIPIGLAQNFATLVTARFFSGGCVPIMSDAVASIVSNIFQGDQARSLPICLYVTVYLASTSFGPVIGSSIYQFLSWRWIGYIELIWTIALFPVLVVGLPETRGSVILFHKAKNLRREGISAYSVAELDPASPRAALAKNLKRPLRMLCTESVVIVSALWAAYSLGTIYLFTQSVEQVYRQLYGWKAYQAGYVQMAIVLGEILGCGLCVVTDHWYFDSATRNDEIPGTPIPEARLYPSIIGGFFGVTCGMFVYGWTAYPSVHWIAPTIGLTMIGFGTTAVIIGNANYLVDAYSKYAASALGAVGLVENISLAFLPLAASAMYTDLGFQWASSLLAFLSLALIATPCLMLRWGRNIRSRSPFMKEAIIDRRRDALGHE